MAISTNLVKKVGSISPDNLIAGTTPPAQIEVVKATGPVVRGQILTAAAGSAVAKMAAALSSANHIVIAAEDDSTTGAVVIHAYKTGCFNYEAVQAASGRTLVAADVEALHLHGIELVHQA